MRYRVAEDHVAHRALDGEVIAIDFASGAYFIMQGTAGEIWRMLIAGAPVAAIVAQCLAAGAPAGQVEDEVGRFVDELVAARLIEIDPGLNGNGAFATAPLAAYATPALEKFEDMSELIMIDPVHDVSDAGWTHRPQAQT
jgi:hypothetical protein